MGKEFPYLATNKNVAAILEKIKTAEVPERFTNEFLKKLGFTSSNDRAIIRTLKSLGFLNENGIPTSEYHNFKDKPKSAHVLAEQLKKAYSELFSIDPKIYQAQREEVKGAIARISGKPESMVEFITSTFFTLAKLADFSTKGKQKETDEEKLTEKQKEKEKQEIEEKATGKGETRHRELNLRYNIQIHLPATTDLAVYNAIFKSIKEHLVD